MKSTLAAAIVVAGLGVGCASPAPIQPADVGDRLRDRTGATVRTDASAPSLPPGVLLADGLTEDEAVAVALWNNADFQVQLADLGFARADILEAGLLRNPVLSLLFPLGPKQLEATLKWPIEVLWERPRRVAAAGIAAERVAAALEQSGLDVVAAVRIAYADLAWAEDRARLMAQAASELDEVSRLMQSRLAAGDISELEARTAAIDAARAGQLAARARLDAALRENALRSNMGLALDPARLSLSAPAAASTSCGPAPALLEDALASRPDVRAAELAIEAAGRRLGWERSKIVALTAVLDANAEGKEGFEWGPGIDVGLPLFDRSQPGLARAAAELERATRAYSAVRQRVATELGEATIQLQQASDAVTGWRETVLIPLEQQVGVAQRAFGEGDVSYLFVLDMNRRLTEARLSVRDAQADVARARARVERAIGRRCGAVGKESHGF